MTEGGRSKDWNEGLAEDLQDREFAREFLLAAMEEDISIHTALIKVIRAYGLKDLLLPDSLYQTLQTLAHQDGISVDQFIATAVAGKVSGIETATESYQEASAQHINQAKYEVVLAKVPDVEPCDQLSSLEKVETESEKSFTGEKKSISLPLNIKKWINEDLMKDIEKLVSLSANFSKIFLGVCTPFGVFLLFFYCQKIGYFPSGLSVGDIFPFILLVSAFSTFYSVLIIVCISIAQSVAKFIYFLFVLFKNAIKILVIFIRFLRSLFLNRKKPKYFSKIKIKINQHLNAIKVINIKNKFNLNSFFNSYLHFFMNLVGISLILNLWFANRNFAYGILELIGCLIIFIFFVFLLVDRKIIKSYLYYIVLFATSILFSLVIGGIQSPILNLSMKSIGLLQEDVILLLPEQQYRIIQSLSSNELNPNSLNELNST